MSVKRCVVLLTTLALLQIREHREQGIYLEGVRELNMTSPDMIYDVLRVGCAARSTASTRMNQVSDRVCVLYGPLGSFPRLLPRIPRVLIPSSS